MHKRKKNESHADYEERLYKNRTTYGLTWSEITELLGYEQHPDTTRKESYGYLRRIEQERQNDFDNSVMIINDVHLPFERDDVLELVKKHNEEITHLIIAGDLLDAKSISTFPKLEDWTLENEMIYAHTWLTNLRGVLDRDQPIIIINGNHEERWVREIHRLRYKYIQKFINPNMLDNIINGFTLYHDDFKSKVVEYPPIKGVTFVPHWFINIDEKLIVAHPKNYSQVDGKMCENTVAHFLNRGELFDVVVFGHTHKYSQMTVSRRAGKYAVENGCMCMPQDYADSGRLSFTPQHYCYTIVKWNDDEHIDHNNIKVYHLDEPDSDEVYKVRLHELTKQMKEL